MLTDRIDIKAGKFTYGQWIQWLQFLEQNPDPEPIDIIKAQLKILHDYELTDADIVLCVAYLENQKTHLLPEETFKKTIAGYIEQIQEGLTEWANKLQSIALEPEDDELRAGADKLPITATMFQIAERFGQDPDAVCNWTFDKVFLILYNDAKVETYRRNLRKQQKK